MRTRRDALALASLFVALGVTGIACAADVAAAALPGPDARVPRLQDPDAGGFVLLFEQP